MLGEKLKFVSHINNLTKKTYLKLRSIEFKIEQNT